MPVFTETEKKILLVLADGRPHRAEELMKCLTDELAEKYALWQHISRLRKKINPLGQDIVCVFVNRRNMYRHVRLLGSFMAGCV